jgi:hypothetical protein
VISALDELNHELNGRGVGDPVVEEFPRQLVYAVIEIVRFIRDSARDAQSSEVFRQLDDAAWHVEVAWNGLVAGDIADLRRHVSDESAMREPGRRCGSDS